MKRKNFAWKFAFSLTFGILLPILTAVDILFCILIVFTSDAIFNDIITINITIAISLLFAFFIFLILGEILFKKQSFKKDDSFLYQGKLRLTSNSRISAYIGKFLGIYTLTIAGKGKNGKALNLKYYFSSFEEMSYFIFKNQIYQYLSFENRNVLSYILMSNGIYAELGDLKLEKHPCPCCESLTFFEKPMGTGYICPVCLWADDIRQYYVPDLTGINGVTLSKAKLNYKKFGACKEDCKSDVRSPHESEIPK